MFGDYMRSLVCVCARVSSCVFLHSYVGEEVTKLRARGGTQMTTKNKLLTARKICQKIPSKSQAHGQGKSNRMAIIREMIFLLSFLFNVANTDVSEPVFRAKGQNIEMGYCFGVDYIAVFRSSPGGDQLLGNSSEDAATTSLPNNLQGRVTITNHQQLLGLQINRLQHSDSGMYRRECWQNEELLNQHEHDLSVCDEEVDSREIVLMEDGGAVLLCNSNSIDLKGSTIRWYQEVSPLYKVTLFLDSNVSLVPLIKELQGVVEVQRGGAALGVPHSVLQETHRFYCLVIHGQNCLSFQGIYPPYSENQKIIIASEGERVVMVCPSAHKSLVQRWDTPLGNSTTMLVTATEENLNVNQMYLLSNGPSGNYSLVIPVVSEKHSGDYSCFAPSLVVEYSLIVCPKTTSRKKTFSLGDDIFFKCEVTEDGSTAVQWFRPGTQGEDSLIFDSRYDNIPIPKDLSGRVHLEEEGSSLHLSSVTGEDVGEYWCVVLSSPQYDPNDDYDYDNIDNDEDYTEEYVYDSNNSQWSGMVQCISKQVTYLTLADTTPRETAPSSTTTYVVAAVVAGLALVAVIVVGIVIMKKRAKGPQEQKEEGSALQPMTRERARNPESLIDKPSIASEEPDNSCDLMLDRGTSA